MRFQKEGQHCVVFCQQKINSLSAEKNRYTHITQMATYTKKKMPLKRGVNDFNKCYVFALTLLEVLGKTHMSVHENNHGMNEFYYNSLLS